VASTSKRRFQTWRDLSAELKRRRVYPVTAAYAVVAFILLQIGEITFQPLGLPNWVMVGLIALVIVGFPVVVIVTWLFDITPAGIRRDTGPAVANDGRPSIAVLPFVDMSAEKDQGYFCEGVAEEILNALTMIRQLNVAARSSSFQYSAGSGDVRRIGRELGVSTILEGSVRKSENRIRVTAQLVKAADGYHLWSKTYDEELQDVFAIQDAIATGIAQSLLETLSPGQKLALKTTSTSSVKAYEYYLRGRQFLKRLRKMDIGFARQMFQQAIDIDDQFALAWAAYADCHSLLVMYADPRTEYRDEAIRASRRALELAPESAEAHASCGLAHLINDEFEKAEEAFKKAIKRNPKLFEAYYYYARTRFHQGDLDMAADLFRKAAEMDPADYQSRCLRVQILRGTGREIEAAEEAREAVDVVLKNLEWNPDDARAYHLGAGPLVAMGDLERAKSWLHRAIEMDPDDPVLLYNVACNLATINETDAAFDYLEKVVEAGTVSPAWVRNDADLDNLRDLPRYKRLDALMNKDRFNKQPDAEA
jgi:TolB-like protein/Flp pilus assembly protein TadD